MCRKMDRRMSAKENDAPDPYVNNKRTCRYPVEKFDPLDYCWGYARAVDKDSVDIFIKTVCPECEFWVKREKEATDVRGIE